MLARAVVVARAPHGLKVSLPLNGLGSISPKGCDDARVMLFVLYKVVVRAVASR